MAAMILTSVILLKYPNKNFSKFQDSSKKIGPGTLQLVLKIESSPCVRQTDSALQPPFATLRIIRNKTDVPIAGKTNQSTSKRVRGK